MSLNCPSYLEGMLLKGVNTNTLSIKTDYDNVFSSKNKNRGSSGKKKKQHADSLKMCVSFFMEFIRVIADMRVAPFLITHETSKLPKWN